MGNPILSAQQVDLVNAEKAVLGRLLDTLSHFEVTADDLALIRQATADLDELFSLVIIGEFNSGKSSFVNALVGEKLMEEGVTPTTSMINLLRYGSTRSEHARPDGVIERTYPADFLRDIAIVDTPGTNAIIRQHEALTERFVPRSDLVLFVTSSDRPFTESERALLEKITAWGKKIVVILNKIDLFDDPTDLRRVIEFIEDNARVLLGVTPQIFPVSARLAQKARTRPSEGQEPTQDHSPTARVHNQQQWEASGFAKLEGYIFGTLDEASRLRLKLLSPLGVAERVGGGYARLATERLGLLQGDFSTIENIERQLAVYRQDMERSFSHRLSQIDSIVYETRDRADDFFERNIRLGKVFDLMKADRFRQDFEREVVSDLSDRIDRIVQELIEWLVEQELRIWQSVNTYLNRRRQTVDREKEIGGESSSFDYHRRELLQTVATSARDAVRSFDKTAEGQELVFAMRSAVTQTGLAAGGALIGGAVAASTAIMALDVTGLTALTLGSVLALGILPNRRRQAKHDFRQKMEQLRLRVTSAMSDTFESELQRSLERIGEAIAPYSRFVRAEHTKVSQFTAEIAAVQQELAAIRERVG